MMNSAIQGRSIECLIVCLATFIPVVSAGFATAASPNVVLILADDLGYSDLGCYGGEIATPHLDGLAKNGLQFTQFYNTARCWPTRGALLSGYYAQQIHRDALPGLGGGGQGTRQKWATLLPAHLKSAGYRSYHSGKWHIDGPVISAGFDRSLDMRNQGNYFTAAGNSIDDVPVRPAANEQGYYATIATADHAIDCLKDHATNFADKPFFQYIAFIAPHFPLHALPEDIEKYRDRYIQGWDAMRKARHSKQLQLGITRTSLSPLEPQIGPPYSFPAALEKLGEGEVNRPLPWDALSEDQQRFQATKMAIHAAMVDRMDREIGRIIAQLKTMNAFDNTLILFASDNGASAEIMVRDGGHNPKASPGSAASYLCLGPGFSSACNTPHRRHKTWVHEGGISTPLIAHWPMGIQADQQFRTTPAHVIDIAPTILELANVKRPDSVNGEPIPAWPGKSLASTFKANTTIERDCLWWLHEGNRAILVDNWKLVAAKDNPWELYDLNEDRAEQNNLADQMPGKVSAMEALWAEKTNEFSTLAKKTHQPPKPKKQATNGKASKKTSAL